MSKSFHAHLSNVLYDRDNDGLLSNAEIDADAFQNQTFHVPLVERDLAAPGWKKVVSRKKITPRMRLSCAMESSQSLVFWPFLMYSLARIFSIDDVPWRVFNLEKIRLRRERDDELHLHVPSSVSMPSGDDKRWKLTCH